MSNNKQTMKLYTEEEVRKAIKLARLCDHECGGVYFDYTETEVMEELTPIELPSDMLCVNCDGSKPTHNICMDCIIKVGKQNIELPSDDEIENYARQSGLVHPFISRGAKWMRDKIQGGNK